MSRGVGYQYPQINQHLLHLPLIQNQPKGAQIINIFSSYEEHPSQVISIFNLFLII